MNESTCFILVFLFSTSDFYHSRAWLKENYQNCEYFVSIEAKHVNHFFSFAKVLKELWEV